MPVNATILDHLLNNLSQNRNPAERAVSASKLLFSMAQAEVRALAMRAEVRALAMRAEALAELRASAGSSDD